MRVDSESRRALMRCQQPALYTLDSAVNTLRRVPSLLLKYGLPGLAIIGILAGCDSGSSGAFKILYPPSEGYRHETILTTRRYNETSFPADVVCNCSEGETPFVDVNKNGKPDPDYFFYVDIPTNVVRDNDGEEVIRAERVKDSAIRGPEIVTASMRSYCKCERPPRAILPKARIRILNAQANSRMRAPRM